jgi:site-specific recombinase XerD
VENESPWLVPPEPRQKPTAVRRTNIAHLSTLFEGFIAFMSVEKEARPKTITTYRYCFLDFQRFAQAQTKTPLLVSHFSTEMVRAYQYHLNERGLSPTTSRTRLSVLAAFGKWAVRNDRLTKNPWTRSRDQRDASSFPTRYGGKRFKTSSTSARASGTRLFSSS